MMTNSGSHFDAGEKYGQIIGAMLETSYPTILNFKGHDSPTQADGTTRPLAIFHGLGDDCSFPGMSQFTKYMAGKLGSYVKCVEIGNGPVTSWFEGFEKQAEMACKSVQANDNFKGGINTLGLSHGALIARYIAESCPGITVHKWVSIGGPN